MKQRTSISILCGAMLALAGAVWPAAGQLPEPAELERVMGAAAACESGQSYAPFRQIEQWVRLTIGHSEDKARLEEALVNLLQPGATVEAREFAAKQLGVIGDTKALPALAELLKNPEDSGFACLALTTFPRGGADEVLRGALGSAKGRAQVQMINLVGDRRDELAVPLLVPVAWGQNRAAAEAAIASLGKIGDDQARQALAALRERGAPGLHPVLMDATLRCAGQMAARGETAAAVGLYQQCVADKELAGVRRSAFTALLRLEPAQAKQRILQAIHQGDSALIPAAIAAIAWLPGEQNSEPFVRELPALEPQEQVLMLHSLARRGDYAALDAIGQRVASPDPLVRRAALSDLGRAGDMASVPVLVDALEIFKNPEDLREAEAALAELGGGSATDGVIVNALSHSAGKLRVHLVSAIARREGERANALLLEEAANADPAVAVAALRALGRTARPGDVPALLTKLSQVNDPDVSAEAESAAVQATGRIEEPARRSAMVREALDRAQTDTGRCALLALMPSCADQGALDELRAAVVSKEPAIHEAGLRALADWPDMRAWEPLFGAYRQAQLEPARGIALRGLVRLASEANAHPEAALVERYKSLLEAAKNDAEVKLILGALSGDAQPEALDLAQTQAERSGVKAEAEMAMKKISEALKEKAPKPEAEAAGGTRN